MQFWIWLSSLLFPAFRLAPTTFSDFSTFISVAVGINLVFQLYENVDNAINELWDWEKAKAPIEKIKKLEDQDKAKVFSGYYDEALKTFDKRWEAWKGKAIKKAAFYKKMAGHLSILGVLLLYFGPYTPGFFILGIFWLWVLIVPLPLYYAEGFFAKSAATAELKESLDHIEAVVAMHIQ